MFKETLKSVLPEIVKHQSPCETLGWGNYKGCPMYVRRMHRLEGLDSYLTERPVLIADMLSRYTGSGNPLICVKSIRDEVNYFTMCRFKDAQNISDLEVTELIPTGAEYIGATVFGRHMITKNTYKAYAEIYVPFTDGPNGSKIPVIWTDPYAEKDALYMFTFCDYLAGGFSEEKFKAVIAGLKEALPSVDLETQKDKRYAPIGSGHDYGFAGFTYNRNHIAYNGNISVVEGFAPVLLKALDKCDTTDMNIASYLNEEASGVDSSVIGEAKANSDISPTVHAGRGLEENPLLHAANLTDPTYGK